MTPYVKIPLWAYHAMEEGRITDDQFNVLCFAYYKADWTNLVVASYSAENLCRFLRLDATKANLKRFQRAERELQRQGVVRDDYRRGDKRPFHLWLPSVETEKIESLYIQPLVADPVADSVGDATNTSHTESGFCHANSNEILAASVAEKGMMMSLKDHCGSSQFEEPERNPPKSPSGGLLPPRPVNGGHSIAVGLLKPSTGKATSTPKSRSLTAGQCKALDQIVIDFRLAWAKHKSFDPDAKHVFALLKEFSPWEVQIAYEEIAQKARNNNRAVFFRKTAADLIRKRRQDRTEFVSNYPQWFDTHCDDLDSAQERWCFLFGKELPLRFWKDEDGHLHFYHPALYRLLRAWGAELQCAEAAKATKIKAERERIAAEERQKAQEQAACESAEQQKRTEQEWQQRIEDQKRTHQANCEKRRHKAVEMLSKRLSKWQFDGVDKWERYGGSVRVSQTGEKIELTDSQGKSVSLPLNGDLDMLLIRCEGID